MLPTGVLQQIYFILLEMPDELAPFVDKHVIVEGEWKGIALPIFENVAILKVGRISKESL